MLYLKNLSNLQTMNVWYCTRKFALFFVFAVITIANFLCHSVNLSFSFHKFEEYRMKWDQEFRAQQRMAEREHDLKNDAVIVGSQHSVNPMPSDFQSDAYPIVHIPNPEKPPNYNMGSSFSSSDDGNTYLTYYENYDL